MNARWWIFALGTVCLGVGGLSFALARWLRPPPPQPEVVERSAGNVFLEPGRPESWYVQERFTFVNAHPRQTAVLHEKQRSCGCATCEIVPATVAPGDAAQIALRFGVPYLRGQRREWALIGTDLDTYPQFLVSVSASIYPRLDVRVLAADNAQAGQQLARVEVVAYQPAAEPVHRLSLRVASEAVEIRPLESARVEIRESVRKLSRAWSLRLVPERHSVADATDAVLVATYGPWRQQCPIPWHWQRPIEVAPSTLLLQPLKARSASSEVTLTSSNAFAIVSAAAIHGIEVDYVPNLASTSHTLKICAQGDSSADKVRKELLVIETTHPEQPTITIPVYVLLAAPQP